MFMDPKKCEYMTLLLTTGLPPARFATLPQICQWPRLPPPLKITEFGYLWNVSKPRFQNFIFLIKVF